jgi:Divergent InlB B-repeat domain
VRRIAILLAAIGALTLIPAAQAFAGSMTVNVTGSGKGEVTDGKGGGAFGKGSPPLACKYDGASKSGVCENLPQHDESETYFIAWLIAHPAAGSEFGGWKVTSGPFFGFFGEFGTNSCPLNSATTEHTGPNPAEECYFENTETEPSESEFEVTATFCKEGTAIEEEVFNTQAEVNETRLRGCSAPTGPTNLRTLTLTKSPAPNAGAGTGSVSSKPKGIKCGTTCDEAVAAMYKNTPVVLSAKPGGETSSFVKWVNPGGACNESTSPTCTLPIAEDESIEAVFGGTSKAFSPAEALTVSKGESSGKGTVKAAGLGCEAECTSTTVLYQGPITEPKPKPGKTVILKQAPAFGSEFAGWSGCESEPEGNCQVAMETAKEVVAEYDALPGKVLTVNKSYSSGNGAVSSKPKGIKCGTACTQAVAQMPEGAPVELIAKPSSGTFVKWEGGDCGGSTNPVCVVTMNADETTKAVFSDPGKAFAGGSEATLTLSKEGSGFGTVKAAGLGCEVLCSSTSVLYQGPLTEPKPKPGKTVILKAVSAPGSQTVVWSGCDSETEAGECVVEMDESHGVTATFDELE